MMTRQIIQLRAALIAWVVAMVLAVSFLPASAPPAHAGPHYTQGTGDGSPSGGPDEPDDKNPGAMARITGPRVVAAPAARYDASDRAQRLLPNRGLARWLMILRITGKVYLSR